MTNSDSALLDDLRKRLETVLEHAVAFKALFHDTQDAALEWQDKYIARGRVISKQRKIIAKLEAQLDIDQEL